MAIWCARFWGAAFVNAQTETFLLRGGSISFTQLAANWAILGLGQFWMGNRPQGPDPAHLQSNMATFCLVLGKGLTCGNSCHGFMKVAVPGVMALVRCGGGTFVG